MGLRGAAVALGILGVGLPSCFAVVDRPFLACVSLTDTADGISDERLTLEKATAACCSQQGIRYFALGGNDPSLKTQHNLYKCVSDITELVGHNNENIVDVAKCHVGCPGDNAIYDSTIDGTCGAGCKGCPKTMLNRRRCKEEVACGVYRSVYSCDVCQMNLGWHLRNERDPEVLDNARDQDTIWGMIASFAEETRKTPSWCEGKDKTGRDDSTSTGGGSSSSGGRRRRTSLPSEGSSSQSGSSSSQSEGSSTDAVERARRASGTLAHPPKATINHNPTQPTNAKFHHPFYPKSLLER